MASIKDQSNEPRVLTATLCVAVYPGKSSNLLLEVAARALQNAFDGDTEYFIAAKSLESGTMQDAFVLHDVNVDHYYDLRDI